MNRTYPNAAGGMKLMFWGQILSIVGGFLTGLGASMAAIDVMAGGRGGLGAMAILGLVVVIVAYVLDIYGLYKAGNDDAGFRTPLMAAVIALVVSVISSFLGTVPFVGALLTIVSTVLNYVVVSGVCQTGGNLLHSVGNEALANRGATVAKIYFICTVISVVCTVIGVIPIINILSGLVSVVSGIVLLVGYIMYLTFLNGGSNAL